MKTIENEQQDQIQLDDLQIVLINTVDKYLQITHNMNYLDRVSNLNHFEALIKYKLETVTRILDAYISAAPEASRAFTSHIQEQRGKG